MLWDRRPAARIIGFLLSLCAGFALGRAAQAAGARELGILGPFYRATQLQGHLIGMGLIDVPGYLTTSDIDLKYRTKPGMTREIPFADSFTINRFLGGYREDWLRKFREWTTASAAARSITRSGRATARCSFGRS
jgi:hypothetical protein